MPSGPLDGAMTRANSVAVVPSSTAWARRPAPCRGDELTPGRGEPEAGVEQGNAETDAEREQHGLDEASHPGRPIRQLLPAAVVEAELDRLAAQQRDDGAWAVDWNSQPPARSSRAAGQPCAP